MVRDMRKNVLIIFALIMPCLQHVVAGKRRQKRIWRGIAIRMTFDLVMYLAFIVSRKRTLRPVKL